MERPKIETHLFSTAEIQHQSTFSRQLHQLLQPLLVHFAVPENELWHPSNEANVTKKGSILSNSFQVLSCLEGSEVEKEEETILTDVTIT